MLAWIGLLIVLSAIAGVIGFAGIGGAVAGTAQMLFAAFLFLLVLSVAFAALGRR